MAEQEEKDVVGTHGHPTGEGSEKKGKPTLRHETAKKVFDQIGREKALKMYEDMCRIRRFEEEAGRQYQMGNIKGFCHLYIGQEAVAVGSMAPLEERDYVVAAYREHGHAIAKGVEENRVMAELFGKKDGATGGIGGSMHIFDVAKGFYGGWGIVSGHIPTAAGIAFGSKYRKEDAVTLCYFGDGSVHQGVVHETLNLAQLWKMPVIFITENNLYGMGTAVERVSADPDLAKIALSYDMAHDTIDGDDIFVVYDRLKEAIDLARKENLPTFLDVKTYRYRGHSMSDPARYRTKDEVDEHMHRDPIIRFGNWLVEQQHATQEELDAIDKAAKKEAKDAVAFAKKSPQPDLDVLTKNVYVDPPKTIF